MHMHVLPAHSVGVYLSGLLSKAKTHAPVPRHTGRVPNKSMFFSAARYEQIRKGPHQANIWESCASSAGSSAKALLLLLLLFV